MSKEKLKFLIVGLGSIGERHTSNLIKLGYKDITVLRSRNLPPRNVELRDLNVVNTWEAAFNSKPDLAIICTPTSLHESQAIKCLNQGVSVLVEKPISNTLKSKKEMIGLLEASPKLFCFTAYMMRFHPAIKAIEELIANCKYGKLRSFHSHWGEHLPDWHPWEDYKKSYAARKDLGGGAILTLSHDIDVALHLIDSPLDQYKVIKNDQTLLETTDTDDASDIIMKFENGVTGHIHLNFFQKNAERKYEYRFDDATVIFDYFSSTISIINAGETTVESFEKFDRNQLFLDELKYVISQLESPQMDRLAELKRAYLVTKICLT